MSRRHTTVVCASVLLVVLTCVAFLLPVPYVTFKPGPTFDALGSYDDKPVIEIGAGAKTYETSGSLSLTTVSVTRPDSRISLVEAFVSYFDSDDALVPRDLVYPEGETVERAEEQTAAQMSGSQLTSEAAALEAAGYPVDSVLEVATVTEDGPSDGVLEPGDAIRAVAGRTVRTSARAAEAIAGNTPGSDVRLRIVRDDEPRTVTVTTVPDQVDGSKARVGITLGESLDLPFTIENNLGRDIGGPSAGSMFALAIYDKLTRGDLTGGRQVAGTGEIDADGTIIAIGGIHQKIVGAAGSGASVFLVPADNCAEAVAGGDEGMTLVKMSELEDAIASLETLAEDPDAKVASCS